MECILLHGWGVTNTVWRDFVDTPGGFKKNSAPCMYEAAKKTDSDSFESVAVTIKEAIKSDTVIIAWSIGGLVATKLANLTDKVKAIIFLASTPCFVNKKDWKNAIDKKGIDDLKLRLSKDTKSALEYFAGLIAYGDTSKKETNKIIRNNLADKKHNAILASWLKQMQEADLRKELSELNIPMLVILGKNDSLINHELEEELKVLNPKIICEVIDDCGHAPFISKQKETTEIIKKFFNAKLY